MNEFINYHLMVSDMNDKNDFLSKNKTLHKKRKQIFLLKWIN